MDNPVYACIELLETLFRELAGLTERGYERLRKEGWLE